MLSKNTGFSRLKCQLKRKKIDTACFRRFSTFQPTREGANKVNSSSFRIKNLFKFVLAWLARQKQNILTPRPWLHILGDPGADSGDAGKSKRAEKYGTKKSKERREEPLGTMSYQTSSNGRRRSGFWLVPENLCLCLTRHFWSLWYWQLHQKLVKYLKELKLMTPRKYAS